MQDKIQELRDQFAMSALSGILSNPECSTNPIDCAERCYEYADAMIAERAKSQPAETGDTDLMSALKTAADQVSLIAINYVKPTPGFFYLDRLEECERGMRRAIKAATAKQSSELPERWCIKRTRENAEMVNAWANNRHPNSKDYTEYTGYVHSEQVSGRKSLGHIHPDGHQSAGYTPITDDQFRRLVLKHS